MSSTTAELTTSSDNIIFTAVAVIISTVCSLLLILLIVCYVAYKCYFRRQMLKPTTKIFMQLNLDKTSLYLHIITLKDDILCYTFSSNASTQTYKVIGKIFPYLSLDWPDLCNLYYGYDVGQVGEFPACYDTVRCRKMLLGVSE